jgi:arylsulfatase A-like enzyme
MKDYLRCIAGVDDSVGEILDYLKKNNLSDNTVVFYCSDQGFYLGEHGWFDKRFMYKESFRTPLIVRWPGVVKPGSINSDLTQNIDLAETFLNIADAPIPSDMQGKSLVPLLEGKTPVKWRKSLYYHYYMEKAHGVPPHEGVRNKRYKLIHFYKNKEWEFYDLENDPNEMKNGYNNPEYANKIMEMKKELKRLREYYKVNDDL